MAVRRVREEEKGPSRWGAAGPAGQCRRLGAGTVETGRWTDREAWRAAIYGVAKSRTRLSE